MVIKETTWKIQGTFPLQAQGKIKGPISEPHGEGRQKRSGDQEKYGFPANAIVNMAEVTEHLYNKECGGKVVIDDGIKAAIDAYYEQYGAK